MRHNRYVLFDTILCPAQKRDIRTQAADQSRSHQVGDILILLAECK